MSKASINYVSPIAMTFSASANVRRGLTHDSRSGHALLPLGSRRKGVAPLNHVRLDAIEPAMIELMEPFGRLGPGSTAHVRMPAIAIFIRAAKPRRGNRARRIGEEGRTGPALAARLAPVSYPRWARR